MTDAHQALVGLCRLLSGRRLLAPLPFALHGAGTVQERIVVVRIVTGLLPPPGLAALWRDRRIG